MTKMIQAAGLQRSKQQPTKVSLESRAAVAGAVHLALVGKSMAAATIRAALPFPELYDFPPFFTLQPVIATLRYTGQTYSL